MAIISSLLSTAARSSRPLLHATCVCPTIRTGSVDASPGFSVTSTFAWLDFDEPARQRMREIVEMLREEGSIDELGLGRMRDAFSDRLFPGTSVLWRRARYLLFVPWMYQQFETDGIGRLAPEIAARRAQAKLRDGLRENGATNGLIGARAKYPVSPPDVILWAALSQWGVRESGAGTLSQYRTGLPPKPRRALEDDAQSPASVWNPQLPRMPKGFPKVDGFELKRSEAQFLRDLVLAEDAEKGSRAHSRKDSLMADLLRGDEIPDVPAPWQRPLSNAASADLRRAVSHAGCFSDVIHGATLHYARRLAEVRKKKETLEAADDALEAWAQRVSGPRAGELKRWADNLDDFFEVVTQQRRILSSEKRFVTAWTRLALTDPFGVARNVDAIRLVEDREAHSKRGKARLAAPREQDRGDGGNIPGPLTFRWANALQLAHDIREGLEN